MIRQNTDGLLMKMTFLPILFFLLFTSSAFSRPMADQYATVYDGDWGGTKGGEFNITVSGYNVDFTGFCLELNEDIDVFEDSVHSGVYRIDSVVNYSEKGGTHGQTLGTTRDPLSAASKWVYWNYINGAFGYNHSLANDVQRTIWALEDENDGYFLRDEYIDPDWDDTYLFSSFYYDYITSTGWNIDDTSHWGISGDVYVLNLMEGNTFIQSVIVGEPVPEPATMLLFATGLIGLAGVSYRRKKK